MTLGGLPGSRKVVLAAETAVGDRIEPGRLLGPHGGLDQCIERRVVGEWRPGKRTEQRREHGFWAYDLDRELSSTTCATGTGSPTEPARSFVPTAIPTTTTMLTTASPRTMT